MNKADKINFIFQIGKKAHIHIENQVFGPESDENCIFSDLSMVQSKVAMQIQQTAPVSLSDLANTLGLSHPSASVIVEKLVEKEIVSRETDPQDRRRIQLRIHPQSSQAMSVLQDRLENAFSQIARKVGDENLERWYQVALKLNDILTSDNNPL